MHLRRRHLVAAGALILVVLFLIQRLSSPSDERQIERTIDTVATSANPAYCGELITDGYAMQITGARPPFADDLCEYEASTQAAELVRTRGIAVDGDRATAIVAFIGGSLDGSEVQVRLLHSDGDWKLDRLTSFVRFDRARFRRAYWRRFLQFGAPPQAADCAIKQERLLSSSEIERALLQGRSGRTFAPIAVRCDRRGAERGVVRALAAPELDLSRPAIECAERALNSATNEYLVQLELDTVAYGGLILRCDRTAFADSVRRRLEATHDRDSMTIECAVDAFRGLPPAAATQLIFDQARYAALINGCEATS